MTDLTPIAPLGAPTPRQDSHGAYQLNEITTIAMASLTARLGGEAPRPNWSNPHGEPAPGLAIWRAAK